MNTNEIIKAFDVNEVTIDETNIYLKFTIDRQKALTRNAKYIKVCLEATENIVDLKKTKEEYFLDDLSFSFKSNSSPVGLNLYKFENNLLDLTIEDDEVSSLKEYFLSIPKVVARSIVGFSIDKPVVGVLGNIEQETIQEKNHAFKVYILNNSKSILEKYSYESDYKIEEYTTATEVDEFVFRSLEGSLDLVLTPYNELGKLGPYLNVNKELLDNPAIDKDKILLSLSYNNETYSFKPEDFVVIDSPLTIVSQLSKKPIEKNLERSIFRRDFLSTILLRSNNSLIERIFEKFYIDNLNEDTIEFKFIYENEEIIKHKKIDRSTIESLYKSYFNKNKDSIIRSLLRGKIAIDSLENQSGFSILFKKYTDYLIPVSDFQNKIKICTLSNGVVNPIEKLYVSTSFDNDISLETYGNNGFLVQSIYDLPNNNSKFYIKPSSGISKNFIVYFNNVEIFRSEVFNTRQNFRNVNVNSSGYFSVGINRRMYFDNFSIFNSQQSIESNLTHYFFSINSCFSSPRINQINKIEFEFDSSELRRNISTVPDFGYEVNNNDYINRDIIDNVILKFMIRNMNNESIVYLRLKNILENNKIVINPEFQIRLSEVEIFITSVILPYNMADLMLSNSASDDIKEEMASYLNTISHNNYSMIDRVMSESLFQGKRQEDVIEALFLVLDNYKTDIFTVNNDESLDLNNLLDNIITTEEDSGI